MKGGHASGQTGAWREIELDGIMAEQMNSVRKQTHTHRHTPKHYQPPAPDIQL